MSSQKSPAIIADLPTKQKASQPGHEPISSTLRGADQSARGEHTPEQPGSHESWSCVSLRASDPESAGIWCIEHGASGTATVSEQCVDAYLLSSSEALERFTSLARNAGYEVEKSAPLDMRNWVQECKDVWQPLSIGALTIVPSLSADQAPESAPERSEIRIIPGFGFGTGHHATTAMILEILQRVLPGHRLLTSESPASTIPVLDLGTGSGVLALAIQRLTERHVLGVDIDREALRNAQENIALNHCGHGVSLVCGDISSITGNFLLIAANLYAAVLASIATPLAARVAPGGILLLSGLYLSEAEHIRSLYTQQGLVLLSEQHRGEWAALSFQRGLHSQ